MSRITWDDLLSRFYQVGVSHGVIFDSDSNGFPWNGLIGVSESSSGFEDAPVYIDGIKMVNRRRFGDFVASIDVIGTDTDISSLLRNTFSFCYRVEDVDNYEIHLVYNARAVANERSFKSISALPEMTNLSLAVSTIPQVVDHDRRTSHLVINSRIARSDALAAFEKVIYGDEENNSHLPSPDEVLEIFESHAILRVTDLRNGYFEISGPDEAVYENEDGSWTIDWPSVIQVHDTVYQISSL